jgi:hypothetical protein
MNTAVTNRYGEPAAHETPGRFRIRRHRTVDRPTIGVHGPAAEQPLDLVRNRYRRVVTGKASDMSEIGGTSRSSLLSERAADLARRPDATWVGLDLGRLPSAAEIETRVLAAIDEVQAPVDYVVVHDLTVAVPRASVAIRTLETGAAATTMAKHLHAMLGGTAVVLAPATAQRMAVVLGPPASAWDCLHVATLSRDGLAGRCARFPGQRRLAGAVTVRRLLERSAITAVTGLALPVSPDDLVDVRGPLRPVFEGGHLVLKVVSGPLGTLLPDARPAQELALQSDTGPESR